METPMYCMDCGADVTTPASAAITPCHGCGSSRRSSVPPYGAGIGISVTATATDNVSLRIANGVLELGNG